MIRRVSLPFNVPTDGCTVNIVLTLSGICHWNDTGTGEGFDTSNILSDEAPTHVGLKNRAPERFSLSSGTQAVPFK